MSETRYYADAFRIYKVTGTKKRPMLSVSTDYPGNGVWDGKADLTEVIYTGSWGRWRKWGTYVDIRRLTETEAVKLLMGIPNDT